MIHLHIQSDAQDSALDIIRSAIASETSRLEFGLKATERHIRVFEERYSVTSDTFLRDFAAEDLADGDREYVCCGYSGDTIPIILGERGRMGRARGVRLDFWTFSGKRKPGSSLRETGVKSKI